METCTLCMEVYVIPVQDESESSYTQHLEQCSRREQEIRKQYTNQLRQLEEEKVCMCIC